MNRRPTDRQEQHLVRRTDAGALALAAAQTGKTQKQILEEALREWLRLHRNRMAFIRR